MNMQEILTKFKSEEDKNILLFLDYINKNTLQEDDFVIQDLQRLGMDEDEAADIPLLALSHNLVTMHFCITSEGKKRLAPIKKGEKLVS